MERPMAVWLIKEHYCMAVHAGLWGKTEERYIEAAKIKFPRPSVVVTRRDHVEKNNAWSHFIQFTLLIIPLVSFTTGRDTAHCMITPSLAFCLFRSEYPLAANEMATRTQREFCCSWKLLTATLSRSLVYD
jgi:hypothetical protein